MWRALRSRNACKTCALGMGGQAGGMVNEAGHFPEVCKKSVQAMAADMRGAVRDGFLASTTLEQMGRLSPRELEAAGRLVRPLVAAPGDRHYRPVTWEEAMERAGAALRESPPQETFFYASGRSSNEAGFLLQLVARLHGSNNVNNCSYFCHNASGVALKEAIGSGAGTIDLEGLSACDLVVLVGANPASNHPRLMRTLMDLKRRGGRVVVLLNGSYYRTAWLSEEDFNALASANKAGNRLPEFAQPQVKVPLWAVRRQMRNQKWESRTLAERLDEMAAAAAGEGRQFALEFDGSREQNAGAKLRELMGLTDDDWLHVQEPQNLEIHANASLITVRFKKHGQWYEVCLNRNAEGRARMTEKASWME